MDIKIKEKLMSRTFWLTVFIFVTSIVLLCFGKINETVWGNTVQWVLSSYALKSVGEKWVS